MKISFAFLIILALNHNLNAQNIVKQPIAVLGNLTENGEYVRSDIILQESIVLENNENTDYLITGFDMIIAPKSGDDLVYKSASDKITTEMYRGLNTIEEGDKIIIENIQVSSGKNKNSSEIFASTIALTVKGFELTPFQELPNASGVSIQVGSIEDEDSLNQTSISQQTKLTLSVTDSLDYMLESYNLIIAPKVGSPAFYSQTGSSFSESAIKGIKNIKSGDKIIFEQILVTREVEGVKSQYSVTPLVLIVR